MLALLEEAGEFAAEPLLPNITLDCASTVKFVLRSAKPKKRKAAGDTVLRSGKHAVALRLAILTTQVLGSTMEQVTEMGRADAPIVVGCGEPFDSTRIPTDLREIQLRGGGRKGPRM